MLDAIKMGRWLGITEQLTLAKAEVGAIVHRWDVPQGQRKPDQDPADKEIYIEAKKGVWAVLAHDLRDIKGRYFRTSPDPVTGRQGRVAGRMLQEDMLLGAWSPAIPLLFGILSLLGVLTMIFGGTWLTVPLVVLMFPVAILISTATERFGWGAAAVGLAVVLPWIAGTSVAGSAMNTIGGMGGGGSLAALLPFAVIIGLAVLFGGLRGARVVMGVIVGLALVLLIASHTPAFIRPMILAIPGALMPAAWTLYESMRRAKRLARQGKSSFEASELPLTHIDGRLEQAKRASLDKSPLITMGHATGRFSMSWDGWAPDAGLPVCQSVNDLGTHLLVLGSTGRGKTSSIIRPYVAAWVSAGGNGCLIMDGKGELPAEFAGMKDYLLIDPSKNVVGLYQGMTASEVSRTLREVNVTDSAQGDSRMWNDLAFDMCRHSAVVLEALVELLDMEAAAVKEAGEPEAPRANRPWFWTLHNHQRLAVMGLAGAEAIADVAAAGEDAKPSNSPTLQTYLDILLANHPEGNTGLLAEARHYFLSELPAMPPNVRGSIFTTFSSWLTPITGHKELLAWAQAETGVCVEDCLHGKNVGISLPESRYGRSGAIATAFLKNRVFNQVRQRAGGDWRKLDPTAKPVLMVMDECQILLSDADQEISPIGRSLGCFFLCCSQTIESIRQTSKNQNKTEAFLDSFQSLILLLSSHETVEWVSKRLGTIWRPAFGDGGIGIDFVGGALKSLESPLFDPCHPSKRWMQTLLRRGAGGFKDIAPLSMDRTIEEDLGFDLNIMRGAWEEKPLLSRADFSNLTYKQGVALVSLMRSGSPRRDFINLDQVMDVLPDALMDKSWLAERALQAARQEVEAKRDGRANVVADVIETEEVEIV